MKQNIRNLVTIICAFMIFGIILSCGDSDSIPKIYARNVILGPVEAHASNSAMIPASSVIYENRDLASDICATNVEDALTETNIDMPAHIIGTWEVRNIAKDENGIVTFNESGTYTIDSGKFDNGGSWWSDNNGRGTYTVYGDLISFLYDGWSYSGYKASRVGMIIYKRPGEFILVRLGASHGVEILTKKAALQ